MQVEFLRAEGEERHVVATARWVDGQVTFESDDDEVAEQLVRAFRKTPVSIDDASYRRMGTHGEVVVQPGDLQWFRAVALTRATSETGLLPRFVPGISAGGYDPAAGYRTFEEQIERLSARAERERGSPR
jgi:hypothetical protein